MNENKPVPTICCTAVGRTSTGIAQESADFCAVAVAATGGSCCHMDLLLSDATPNAAVGTNYNQWLLRNARERGGTEVNVRSCH